MLRIIKNTASSCGLGIVLLALIGPAHALRLQDRPGSQQPVIDEVAVSSLYQQIGDATSEFQAGLELRRAGQPAQGRERSSAATDRLSEAAQRCGSTPGCDANRFVEAFQTLLRLQGLLIDPEIPGQNVATEDPLTAAGEGTAAPRLNHQIAQTRAMLKGRPLSEVIPLNEPVKAAMEDWLTWMRPTLIEAWVNYQFLRGEMAPAYQQSGLPEAILFGILAKESAGRVHAVSRAGASGPLQFMPATGRRFGLNSDKGFDLRFDPASASSASVAYLVERLEELNHDLELSLAAYNGGEGRMRRLANKHRGKGFWSDSIYYALPDETRDYVPKVLAAAWLFMHPEEYGLQFPELPTAIGTVTLTSAASLGELSICLGQSPAHPVGWFRTLRNLNPRVQADQRLPAGTTVRMPLMLHPVYAERCHNAEFQQRVAALFDARYPQGPKMIAYTVRRGDTLASLARKSSCSRVADIARINKIKGPNYAIRIGQKLKLPTCS
ncbi:MAG: transglycosylase SLT domain-containing protein [Xanthomonadales bacterium]|nr:transglycosylase SLT domain-containing protein [Xanthomonadales bacterium]